MPQESKSFFDILSDFSTIHWIVLGLLWLATNVLTLGLFVRWLFRRQWHLHKNLKRPILVLRPLLENGEIAPGCAMDVEMDLLRRNGFLNIKSQPTDYRRFDPTNSHSIVVLCYATGMVGLEEVLTKVKMRHVPLIVYTFKPIRLPEDITARLNTYPHTLVANFPLTLLNSIFATAASYPYESE